jgi:hypothetical protein
LQSDCTRWQSFSRFKAASPTLTMTLKSFTVASPSRHHRFAITFQSLYQWLRKSLRKSLCSRSTIGLQPLCSRFAVALKSLSSHYISLCYRFADALQPSYNRSTNCFANCFTNRFEITLQSLYNRFASALQSLYNRLTIALRSALRIALKSFCNCSTDCLQPLCNCSTIALLPLCRRSTTVLQSLYELFDESLWNHFAVALQSVCNRFAVALQSSYNCSKKCFANRFEITCLLMSTTDSSTEFRPLASRESAACRSRFCGGSCRRRSL